MIDPTRLLPTAAEPGPLLDMNPGSVEELVCCPEHGSLELVGRYFVGLANQVGPVIVARSNEREQKKTKHDDDNPPGASRSPGNDAQTRISSRWARHSLPPS